jgi:hypothetical protein
MEVPGFVAATDFAAGSQADPGRGGPPAVIGRPQTGLQPGSRLHAALNPGRAVADNPCGNDSIGPMARYVEKIRVLARVVIPREQPLDGMFSLGPQSQHHEGPETLLERLNSSDRVLPFQRDRDGAILLIQRRDIECVEPGRGVDATLVRPPTWRVTREERVQLRFSSGKEVSGALQMELPEDFNRASDFLNGPEDFFALVTPQGVLLVNKNCLSTVRVLERSPRPMDKDAPAADAA